MNHPPTRTIPRRDRPGAFTLVELLVVIGILAVLMGILLPVVSHVRTAGYTTSTANQLLVLQGGIEQYRQTFEAYPGPLAENELKGMVPGVPATSANIINNISPRTGSENLVFGLLGGISMTVNSPNITLAYNAALVGGGPNSLNPLKTQRYPAFVDPVAAGLDTLKIGPVWVKWGGPNNPHAGQGVKNQLLYSDTDAPEFVDRYPDPLPILYIRAKVGATNVVPGYPNASPTATAAYDPLQLGPYVVLFPTPDFATTQAYFGTLADNTVARQKDGFLLISAGPDRKYGTSDDVTNGGALK